MRVKVTERRNGKIVLELGYYKKNIILEDSLELVQVSSDLNSQISKIFSTKKQKKQKEAKDNNTKSKRRAKSDASTAQNNKQEPEPCSEVSPRLMKMISDLNSVVRP